MAGGGNTSGDVYTAALERRQKLMGASGPAALVKNFKVFRIAAFACIGGVLYGYNQGMFSGVLAMPAFKERKCENAVTDSRRNIEARQPDMEN